MRLALVQMEVLPKNKAANVRHGLELVRQAAADHEVVVLPEIWTTGYSLGHLHEEAEDLAGPVVEALGRIARENSCTVVAGSLPLRRAGAVYNSSLLFSSQGELVHIYDKVHLFHLYHEEKFFGMGQNFDVCQIGGQTVGLSVCYDLRFPELYRHLTLQGASLFFVVAEWPAVRGDVWRLLLRARAMENYAFVVGVNAVGSNRGERFFGHSMVCAPDGRIVAEASEKEEILTADIDLSEVQATRNFLNALADVRKELVR